MTRPEILIQTYWERCWNARDIDRLAEVFHDPYIHNRVDRTPAQHAEIILDTIQSFPDFRVRIDDIEVVGDAVITRCTFLGSHGGEIFGIQGTGRQISAPTLDVYFFREGQVGRLWHLTDHLPILRDIGAEIRVDGALANLD